VVKLMKEAGAIQVQIGIESGDQVQLENMNKRVNLKNNAKALDNCRTFGLTSLVSLVVGFPGETSKSINNTFHFLKSHPPDFHFLCTFSTRVEGVPILSPHNAKRFSLETNSGARTVSPYWRHSTMCCSTVGNSVRKMTDRLISEKVSLEATLFYGGILNFKPEWRDLLLDFQAEAFKSQGGMRTIFKLGNRFIDYRLRKDVQKTFHNGGEIIHAH